MNYEQKDRWRRTGDRSLSRKIINRSSLIHNRKQCHDKDAYNPALESIMSWCAASTDSASLKTRKTTTPSFSAYAVRRSSTLPSETVCPTPATIMRTPLCPTTSISFFMQKMTRSVTSSSALPHHTCIMNSPHGMNTLAEQTSFPCAMSMSYLAESEDTHLSPCPPVDAPLDNDVSCIGHSPVPVSPLFGSIRSRNHKKYT